MNRTEFPNKTSGLGKSYRRKQVLTIYIKSMVYKEDCNAMP